MMMASKPFCAVSSKPLFLSSYSLYVDVDVVVGVVVGGMGAYDAPNLSFFSLLTFIFIILFKFNNFD